MGARSRQHQLWWAVGAVLSGGCQTTVIEGTAAGSSESGTDESTEGESGALDDPTAPEPPNSCGDGILDPGEECDQGLLNADEALCKSDCTNQRCGDGFIGPGEDCEDGNEDDDDACVACSSAACGDGHVQAGVEACDDGNIDETDACLSSCAIASCGDGHVQIGVEDCDDGNGSQTDACLSNCQPASCGDGFVFVGVEDCDDGNFTDEDGCSSMCSVEPNYVFLSSDSYTGLLGGLAGADSRCQLLADNAGLPGTYLAWLSDGNVAPANRLFHSSAPYVLLDGTQIASDWADLTDGTLAHPISLTELGGNASSIVWTAVDTAGYVHSSNCQSWTTSSSSYSGRSGQSGSNNSNWTVYSSPFCNSSARLYCFRSLNGP